MLVGIEEIPPGNGNQKESTNSPLPNPDTYYKILEVEKEQFRIQCTELKRDLDTNKDSAGQIQLAQAEKITNLQQENLLQRKIIAGLSEDFFQHRDRIWVMARVSGSQDCTGIKAMFQTS